MSKSIGTKAQAKIVSKARALVKVLSNQQGRRHNGRERTVVTIVRTTSTRRQEAEMVALCQGRSLVLKIEQHSHR